MTDFDDAYREHLTSVFRYAVKCVGRREIAEEITAEAFVALYNTFDRIDPGPPKRPACIELRCRKIDFDELASAKLETRSPNLSMLLEI